MARSRHVVYIALWFLLLGVDTSAFSSVGTPKLARTSKLLVAAAHISPLSRRPCSLPVSNLNMVSSRGRWSWRRGDDKSFTNCLLSEASPKDGAAGEIAGTAQKRNLIGFNCLRAVADAGDGLGYSRYARGARSAIQENEASPGVKKPAGILQRKAMAASDHQSAPLTSRRLELPSDPIERFSEKYKLDGNKPAGKKHPVSLTSHTASSGELTVSSKSSPPPGFDSLADATTTSAVGRLISELRSRAFARIGDNQRPRHPRPSDGQQGQQQPGRGVNGGIKQPGPEATGVGNRLSVKALEAGQLKVGDMYVWAW